MQEMPWRARAVRLLVAFYVIVQVTVPAIGLAAVHLGEPNSLPLSWHMFSRTPTDDG